MADRTENLHRIRRGLDIPILGEPQQAVTDAAAVTTVGVLAGDHIGMRPRMGVREGDRVIRGQRLFEDRKNPGVFHTSPAAGVVKAVNRGDRRALISVVIDVEEDGDPPEEKYQAFAGEGSEGVDAGRARALMQESGLWTAIRERPFGKVPRIDGKARSLFVTAIDTQPLAPDVDVVLQGQQDDFEAGLAALVTMMDGAPVHLCVKEGSSLADLRVEGVTVQRFDGPHPAGNPGLHIHLIDPVDRHRTAWHMGYQDAVATGHLFRTGKMLVRRIIAVCGPKAIRPRLVRTRLGASLSQLLTGDVGDGEVRVITGSPLAGRVASGDEQGYLGRYHNQVTLLEEGGERHFLGWMGPGFSAYSTSRLFASSFLPSKKRGLTTLLNGGLRAMIPSGAYDGVMPFDVMPSFLLKALLSGDLERAEELGCLELDEEDLALCTFVCSSKIDHGEALRNVLAKLEKEG